MKKLILPKMHIACGNDVMREAMHYVQVTKKNITATNANILVTHSTADFFNDEFISNMPDVFYVHKNVWKDMCKPFIFMQFNKEVNCIDQIFNGYNKFHAVKLSIKFPDWQTLLNVDNEPQEHLSLNKINFNKVLSSLLIKTDSQTFKINLSRFTAVKTITIPERIHSKAIIMPIIGL